MSDAENDEFLGEFIAECEEGLAVLERGLLDLERAPGSAELVQSIFRAVHSIKGNAGLFGFTSVQALTHAGEEVLVALRDGQGELTRAAASALLAMSDTVRRLLAAGQKEDAGQDALKDRLHAALDEVLAQGGAERAVAGADEATAAGADRSLRVDVQLLDDLMDLAGELVLARNQLLQQPALGEDPQLKAVTQRLNLITSSLQEAVMKTRLQPISNLWSKLPRRARDLALQTGKQVRLSLHGADTELDKTLLEALKDPLTHLVRNAIDHGIESPSARAAAGKPAEGVVSLLATHESGHVNLTVRDDGAGIEPERLRAKAIERSLMTPEQAARATDAELLQLVFLPGFSTAERVTEVSGRGVGMDVVRTNLERIGGTVRLESVPGRGTAVFIRVPLTVTIIPALIVTCDGERYAIPQLSVFELARPRSGETFEELESLRGVPVYRLRGRLLPVLRLRRELTPAAQGAAPVASERNLVVLHQNGQKLGLLVDQVNDTVEIVVKPLAQQLRNVPLFAGATIMGDGRVCLILDVAHLAQRARIAGEEAPAPAPVAAERMRAERAAWVLFSPGEDARMAAPLSGVVRLVKLRREQLEGRAGRELIQLHGELVPFVRLRGLLGLSEEEGEGEDGISVFLCECRGHRVALAVSRILDIVHGEFSVTRQGARAGFIGASVIGGKATELLDLNALLEHHLPPDFGHDAHA